MRYPHHHHRHHHWNERQYHQKKKEADNDDTKKKEEKYPPLSDDVLSLETIKNKVNDCVDNPTATMKSATNIPVQVAALFDYLLTIFPGNFNCIDNKAMAGDRSKAKRQLEFYQRHFPPGCLGFTVPILDKTAVPGLNYLVIERLTFYVVQ